MPWVSSPVEKTIGYRRKAKSCQVDGNIHSHYTNCTNCTMQESQNKASSSVCPFSQSHFHPLGNFNFILGSCNEYRGRNEIFFNSLLRKRRTDAHQIWWHILKLVLVCCSNCKMCVWTSGAVMPVKNEWKCYSSIRTCNLILYTTASH